MNGAGRSVRRRGALLAAVVAVAAVAMPARGASGAGPSVEGRVTVLDRHGKPKPRHDGVVVFLDALEHPAPAPPPAGRQVIRQIRKQFEPGILPILVGTTVEFPNDDVIFHNVFSLSLAKPFDLGMYGPGPGQVVTFDQTGLVKVYCNIHADMVAYLLVLANPHFTVTDESGRFVLSNTPLGGATVRTWYPMSREHPERRVEVTAEGVTDVDLHVVEQLQLEIREEVLSIEHPNKWGQEYRSRY